MTAVHDALIHTMILVAGADRDITNAELRRIGDFTAHLPAFRRFDRGTLVESAKRCAAIVNGKGGLEAALKSVARAIPPKLRETAYALCWEIALVDGKVSKEEARILELLRTRLALDSLAAAAIERGARARFAG
ncbi:MAG: tellurite resistance TerB family protein [Alphaproteobacteria bacterium]